MREGDVSWTPGGRATARPHRAPRAGDIVRACLRELPDGYRAVIVLRDLERRSAEETARILGLSPRAVTAQRRLARRALRSLLEPWPRRRADRPGEVIEGPRA
jgi:DNA-directed RNA polymerase specialized sigma24 family protein